MKKSSQQNGKSSANVLGIEKTRRKTKAKNRSDRKKQAIKTRNFVPVLEGTFTIASGECMAKLKTITEMLETISQHIYEEKKESRDTMQEAVRTLEETREEDRKKSSNIKLGKRISNLTESFKKTNDLQKVLLDATSKLQENMNSISNILTKATEDCTELKSTVTTLEARYEMQRVMLGRHTLTHARADPELRAMQQSCDQNADPQLVLIPTVFRQ